MIERPSADGPTTGLGGGVTDPTSGVERLQALIARYAGAAPALDEVPAATHWPSIPVVDAEAEWQDLRDWVEQLLERFAQLDHHVVPGCWWRHNEHVEALSALRDHEMVSYSDTAPATGPMEWLRALRDVTALLRAWTSELSCGATHQPAPRRLRIAEDDRWDVFVAADLEQRRQAAISAAV
jgi:hypothetical protein